MFESKTNDVVELDANEIVASLNKVYLLLEEINRVILKMFEKCDPTIFYHKRTYFDWKNNAFWHVPNSSAVPEWQQEQLARTARSTSTNEHYVSRRWGAAHCTISPSRIEREVLSADLLPRWIRWSIFFDCCTYNTY